MRAAQRGNLPEVIGVLFYETIIDCQGTRKVVLPLRVHLGNKQLHFNYYLLCPLLLPVTGSPAFRPMTGRDVRHASTQICVFKGAVWQEISMATTQGDKGLRLVSMQIIGWQRREKI